MSGFIFANDFNYDSKSANPFGHRLGRFAFYE